MTTEDVTSLPPEILDMPVQMNLRITVGQRAKLDAYIRYMDRPDHERPTETKDWPKTIQGVFQQALVEYLAKHPLKEKSGPDKKPIRTTKKGTRKPTTK